MPLILRNITFTSLFVFCPKFPLPKKNKEKEQHFHSLGALELQFLLDSGPIIVYPCQQLTT